MINWRTDYPILNYLIKECKLGSLTHKSQKRVAKSVKQPHFNYTGHVAEIYWSPSSHQNISAYMYNA